MRAHGLTCLFTDVRCPPQASAWLTACAGALPAATIIHTRPFTSASQSDLRSSRARTPVAAAQSGSEPTQVDPLDVTAMLPDQLDEMAGAA